MAFGGHLLFKADKSEKRFHLIATELKSIKSVTRDGRTFKIEIANPSISRIRGNLFCYYAEIGIIETDVNNKTESYFDIRLTYDYIRWNVSKIYLSANHTDSPVVQLDPTWENTPDYFRKAFGK